MKLEVGKKYRLNNGEEHVCEERNVDGFEIMGFFYNSRGVFLGQDADYPLSVACEVTDDQYKPLKDFAPFKAGERFRDEVGDVLTICADCETFAWTKINGEDFPVSVASYGIGTTPVTPLDRDEDTFKLWRDMTDAEKGALLLAHHEGKVIERSHTGGQWQGVKYLQWHDDIAYRVSPKPSFLPLEAGKTYQTAREGGWDCIHVEGKYAWLKRHGSSDTAYVWDAKTGESKCLGEGWNIVALEDV